MGDATRARRRTVLPANACSLAAELPSNASSIPGLASTL